MAIESVEETVELGFDPVESAACMMMFLAVLIKDLQDAASREAKSLPVAWQIIWRRSLQAIWRVAG
jgi:hypothetical protein